MRAAYEVAEAIRQFLLQLPRQSLLGRHRRTLEALRRCRTAELGGHVDGCDQCGYLRISYNSCRNRHCPKCQGINKEMWIVQQEDMLLPIAYFHVVFTLPHELNELCMHQPKLMYDLLFKAAWHTLNTLALDPKWLGAKTAATMVLHTWSQTLGLHPHVHCIVPNGGLTKAGQWQFPRRRNGNFLFPVAAMKKLFKGFFMQQLHRTILAKQVKRPRGCISDGDYYNWKNRLYKKEWVVFTKKPFSGVHQVINYLGRYSHRVAITNHRIRSITDQQVSFAYKDYRDGAKKKVMCLQGSEFLRRFCLHVLPPGFRKVRQYGFTANASKARSTRQARAALGEKHRTLLQRHERKALAIKRMFKESVVQCPCCKKGRMQPVYSWTSNKDPPKSVLIRPKRLA